MQKWRLRAVRRRVMRAMDHMGLGGKAAEENRLLAERLAMTLDSMTDAFFAMDREWRFTYVNAVAERLLHQPRAALLGKVIWSVFPEAIGTEFHHQYERALLDNVPVEVDTFYPPLGIWIQLRAFPSPQGLAVSFRDVTQQVRDREAVLELNRELEQRVAARTAELEAANRELEVFSYSLAHDLRSSLAALGCFGQMLATSDGDGLTERGKHFLKRIRFSAAQMDGMTRGLLELARLSKTALQARALDLAPIARHALNDLASQHPQRRAEVSVDAAMPVRGDAVLLTQLLSNLIGNAWKFSAGRELARIEVGSMQQAGGERVYFVRDNGAGFDMAHAGRLFGAFQRLHSTSEYEGMGIGLATVHKIVGRHHGRVWAQAEPDRGATFFFTLAPAA